MPSLDGKVAPITGSSEGIGASLAAALGRRGCRLALMARNEAKLRAACPPGALTIAGDVTIEADRTRAVSETLARFGGLDILINNAGRGSYYSALTAPMEDSRAVFELNFFAPFALAQLALPHLRRSRGTLVNVSSIAGLLTLPWLPVYSASKFALASLTAAQRTELKRDGVNVMGVFPAYVNTGFQGNAIGPAPPPRVVQGKRFAVSAGECAEAIARGIERRRAMVVTPRAAWLLIWGNRLFPGILESRMELN